MQITYTYIIHAGILELDSSVVKSGKLSTILCHFVLKIKTLIVLPCHAFSIDIIRDTSC